MGTKAEKKFLNSDNAGGAGTGRIWHGKKNLRKTGIQLLGDLAWGTHFTQFYKTKQDLLDILVPYFRAGLSNNEKCIWVASDFLNVEEAKQAMRESVPDLDRYLKSGQMEIFPYTDWYLKKGKFELRRVLAKWVKKHDEAVAAGYDGCRVSGNPFWIDNKKDWRDFTAYEAEINNIIDQYRLLVLCTYSLDKCDADEVIDVIDNHQFAIIKRSGKWALIEGFANKKIRHELGEKELHYSSLFNSMTDSFALCELVLGSNGQPIDYIFHEVNPAFEKFTGIKRENILGKTRSMLPIPLTSKSFDIYSQVALTGEPVRFENYNKSLKKKYSVNVYSPKKNYFATIFTDITDQWRAEQLLKAAEEKSRLIVANAPAMIYEMDIHGSKFISVNDSMCSMLGYSRKELMAMKPADMIDEASKKKFSERIKRKVTGENVSESVEYRGLTKDGREMFISVKSAFKYMDGKPISVVVVATDITSRRRVEEALKNSEEKSRLLVRYAPSMIYEIDFRGPKFLNVNDAMCQALGYTREELLATNPLEILDENSKKIFEERMKIYLGGGKISDSVEYAAIKKDGSKAYGLLNISFTQHNGQPVGAIVVAHDITERKKMEEALARSNARLIEVLGSIQDDFYVLDRNWNFVFANRQFTSKIGKEPDDFTGRNIWEMFPDHIGTILEKNYRATMEKREVRRFEVFGKYTNAWYRMRSFPSAEGITVLGSDVTEQKRVETALRESEERLRAISEATPVGVGIISSEGKFIYVNEAYAKGFGYQKEELLGKAVPMIYWNSEERDRLLEALNESGNVTNHEVKLKRKNGTMFWAAVSVRAIIVGGQKALLGAYIDITDRKQMEEQIDKINRVLWALNSSNQALLRAEDETELLQSVCKTIVEGCGHAMVWIGYARNDAAKSVTPEAFAGLERGYLETLNISWGDTELGRGPTGLAIRTGKSEQCKNMSQDEHFGPWRTEALKRGYASSLALPLKQNGKVLGAITIYSKTINGFADEEVDLLGRLADNLAYGIMSLRSKQESQRAQESLRETKEYLDNLLDYANAPIIVWDPEFKITRFNRAFEHLSGFAADKVLGRKLDMLLIGEGKDIGFLRLRESLSGRHGNAVEIPIRRHDGSVRDVIWNSAAISGPDGKLVATIAQGQDVTEIKAAQLQLAAHAEQLSRIVDDLKKLQLAVENASDIIFVTDVQGKILSVNKAIENLLGYRQEEIVGKTLAALDKSHRENFYQSVRESAMSQRRPIFKEVVNIKKSGQTATFELHISPVFDAQGKISSFIGIERDRTEAKAIDRAKTEFISLASHQLRTPLSTISLTAQMLISGAVGVIDDEARGQIEEIFKITDQMAALVDLFLNISRVDMGRLAIDPQPLEIPVFVREVSERVQPQAEKKKVRLTVKIKKGVTYINADRNVLDISLENLLSNAIKYTAHGGRVRLIVEKKNSEMVFSVIDTGIGIPENQLPLVFTKMFRASNVGIVKGVGLGLNMTKNIIEQSGGRIWLESRLGKGSAFYIAIPLNGMKKNQIRIES